MDTWREDDGAADTESTLLFLALCHDIIIDQRSGKYNAASPDELALVNAAKQFGFEFKGKDEQNVLSITNDKGEDLKYKLLDTCEFNSTRKRMSVIVRDE
jgi:magnesium-transporting ATPase (P-type)